MLKRSDDELSPTFVISDEAWLIGLPRARLEASFLPMRDPSPYVFLRSIQLFREISRAAGQLFFRIETPPLLFEQLVELSYKLQQFIGVLLNRCLLTKLHQFSPL